jgi:hypothetical protein
LAEEAVVVLVMHQVVVDLEGMAVLGIRLFQFPHLTLNLLLLVEEVAVDLLVGLELQEDLLHLDLQLLPQLREEVVELLTVVVNQLLMEQLLELR